MSSLPMAGAGVSDLAIQCASCGVDLNSGNRSDRSQVFCQVCDARMGFGPDPSPTVSDDLGRQQVLLLYEEIHRTYEDLTLELDRLDLHLDDRRILADRRSAITAVLDRITPNWRTSTSDTDLQVARLRLDGAFP